MKLSMLKKLENYDKIINEKEFETLGILDSAIKCSYLTFLDDEKYLKKIEEKENISMVITTKELGKMISRKLGIMICDKPRITFFNLHNKLCNEERYIREKMSNKIGVNCSISPLSCIESSNIIIGNNVIIEEFVSIKSGTVIGDNSIIRAGSVIGSSGFEFKRSDNIIIPVNHYGGVVIGQNVEIKCNTVIDRAIYPWDNTEIGDYCKLDNLIHIGHACKIRKRVMIPANSVIGGRVEIENDSWIGIGCAIRNGVHIGKNSRCNMGAVVTKDVLDNTSVTGNFAIEHQEFIKKLKQK